MKGIMLFGFFLGILVIISAHCPNQCSLHGECSGQDICTCYAGFVGGDCSQRSCPTGKAWTDIATATDTAHAEVECSNRGTCNTKTGQCTCDSGFEGYACQRMACPSDCNNRGECVSMEYHASVQYSGDPATSAPVYSTPWDAEKIYGCVCDPQYHGYDCSLRHCPVGDDPLTTGQVNEIQVFSCLATSGELAFRFGGYTTPRIAFNADQTTVKTALESIPSISGVNVLFESGALMCDNGAGLLQGISIEFTQDFGNLDYMEPLAYGAGVTTFDYHTGTLGSYTPTDGTKESENCSNRGTCDSITGICSCFTDFGSSDGYNAIGIRNDCGYKEAAISACAGESGCSGHGVCSGASDYRCTCGEGWTGFDCSDRTCAYGKAWFDAPSADNTAHAMTECSNKGTCDRGSGQCICQEGFTGEACERITCPDDCSNHGECLNMAQLAPYNEVNGVDTPMTYGSTPNLATTWDYDMMMGCKCDDGYEGYNCALRSCPTGDDPRTYEQVDEVQVMQCMIADGQTFTLTFRDQTTGNIDATATAAEMKAAIELLTTVGTVSVELEDTKTQVCEASGATHAMITFMTEHGDLPDMTATPSAGTINFDYGGTNAFTPVDSVTGTKEEATCSNRGLCDTSTGTCTCFTQYGSSDGMGNAGSRGDCGHILPYVPVTTSS
eukprot:TRINITY_DN9728_c0_g1_i1.p1 TRINITY_DN9728_c0_g1~~TRINITY_DN9728_c0_g1_i1.p1  ORF type:complete len:668 (-),score=245.26 TRINITY_DN9728_c0_g1_i1:220-2223(-)